LRGSNPVGVIANGLTVGLLAHPCIDLAIEANDALQCTLCMNAPAGNADVPQRYTILDAP
jgi:hypothetical protein